MTVFLWKKIPLLSRAKCWVRIVSYRFHRDLTCFVQLRSDSYANEDRFPSYDHQIARPQLLYQIANLMVLTLLFCSRQAHHSPSMVHLPSMFERKYHTFSRSTTHLYWGVAAAGGSGGARSIVSPPSPPPSTAADGKLCLFSCPELKKNNLLGMTIWYLSVLELCADFPSPTWHNIQLPSVDCTDVRDGFKLLWGHMGVYVLCHWS